MKTTPITKKEFLDDVMHEINMLKKHATKEEKENLDFLEFNPLYPTRCIYGQLTGNCANKRAKDLMDKSCIRVMSLEDGVDELRNKTFNKIKNKINGKYTQQTWEDVADSRFYSHLSSLEGYIALKNAKNEQILQYIKGEIDTIKL